MMHGFNSFYLVLVHEIKVNTANGIKKLVTIISLGFKDYDNPESKQKF